MHDWSETDFDWAALDDACNIIYFWSHKVGRFGGSIKEKYGTLRFYAAFYGAWWPLYELCKPGYVFYRWWKPLMYFEIKVLRPVVLTLRIDYPIQRYQHMIYRYAYRRALKKYPHIRDEILCCADYPELLKGL